MRNLVIEIEFFSYRGGERLELSEQLGIDGRLEQSERWLGSVGRLVMNVGHMLLLAERNGLMLHNGLVEHNELAVHNVLVRRNVPELHNVLVQHMRLVCELGILDLRHGHQICGLMSMESR